MVVLTFAILTLIGMLLFLVPVFQKIFTDLGGDLPTLTKGVVFASNGVRGYWFILFPADRPVRVGLQGAPACQEDAGRAGQVLGSLQAARAREASVKVVLKVTMARFSRTLATLVAAGVDIIKALEISGTDVRQLGRRVGARRSPPAKVHQGVPLSPSR